MSKYAQVLAKNPPRLVVQYKRKETRQKDEYAWGFVGTLSTSHLIGMIVRVQAELAFRNPDKADDPVLVMCYDANKDKFEWFVDPSIPVDPLVGTLEVVKQFLLDNQIRTIMEKAEKAVQTGLVDPAGKPILKGG